MIVWGSGGDCVDLGVVETKHCEVCEKERPFNLLLQYRYWGIYWIFNFITKRSYMVACDICSRGWDLDKRETEKSLGSIPIPFMTRFGLLLFVVVIAGLLVAGGSREDGVAGTSSDATPMLESVADLEDWFMPLSAQPPGDAEGAYAESGKVRLSATYHEAGKGGRYLQLGLMRLGIADLSFMEKNDEGALTAGLKEGERILVETRLRFYPWYQVSSESGAPASHHVQLQGGQANTEMLIDGEAYHVHPASYDVFEARLLKVLDPQSESAER